MIVVEGWKISLLSVLTVAVYSPGVRSVHAATAVFTLADDGLVSTE